MNGVVEELPATIYTAGVLISTACLSSIALSIHRYYYNSHRIQLDNDSIPYQYDTVRDYTVPFTDNNRLTRVFFDSFVMTLLSSYNLVESAVKFSKVSEGKSQKGLAYEVMSNSLITIAWSYILALTIVSRRYRLPNRWGFVINIHLFVFYATSLMMSLYSLWYIIKNHHTQMTLMDGLPLVLSIMFSFDLFYTTGSIEQGQPYLDTGRQKGKAIPVSGITVASIFSSLYFSWGTSIVMGVYDNAKNIVLPSLPPSYRSYNLYYIFGLERHKKSLVRRLIHANIPSIIIQIGLTIVSAALYYTPAFFLNKFLNLISEIDAGQQDEFYLIKGVFIVSGLAASLMLLSIVVGQLYYRSSSSLRVRIKSMLNIELYRKTLRRMGTVEVNKELKVEGQTATKGLDSTTNEDTQTNTVGTIVNLMSTDSQRISNFTTSWFVIIEAPIELLVGITFLYSLLGSSCLLGLSVMIITLPLNHYNSHIFAKTQEKLMDARDKRVSLMNEVLQGIRQIKFFAWESIWEKRIIETRENEIKHLRTILLSEVLFNFLWQGTPLLVTVVSFFAFTKIQGQVLTAPIAFTAIAIFTELRSALNSLPETFVDALQALISVRRIESYLEEEEIEPPTININPNCKVLIGFKNATVSWVHLPTPDEEIVIQSNVKRNQALNRPTSSLDTRHDDSFVLHSLTCRFPNDKFSIICGATGSGKTLMMLSLLGETVLVSGESFCPRAAILDGLEEDSRQSIELEDWIVHDGVAYVPQTAWLRNATIRDNILFGLPFVESRYRDTIYAVALHKDLLYLEDGDQTEIGEKGITLSGGQRARVALARAVYSRAKNVFMDDVLSAVDAHTAHHLYNHCFMGSLMEGRTRILITHHVGLCLPGVSYVVHLENGRSNFCGTPEELEGRLDLLLDDAITVSEVAEENQEDKLLDTKKQSSQLSLMKLHQIEDKKPKVLIQEEKRAIGNIKTGLYKFYFKALGGYVYWIILFAFLFGSRGLDVAENWWIKRWVHASETNLVHSVLSVFRQVGKSAFLEQIRSIHSSSFSFENLIQSIMTSSHDGPTHTADTENNESQLNKYLSIYILITMTNIITGAGRFAVLYYGTLKASKTLYQKLLLCVLRAPIRFFDTTPIGRILNRFSKDFEYIDSGVPNDLIYFMIQWLVIVTSILTVCSVLPILIIPMTLVTIVNMSIGKKFSAASRELRRMDSITRSPLFTHFGETLVGVTTIRAYGVTQQLMREMLNKVDANARPFYYAWITNRWVAIRFSFLGAMANFFTGLFILFSLSYIDASLAGFCLSFIMSYTSQMTMAIKRFTRLEMSFNAVERVVEFMEIEQEPDHFTNRKLPQRWPSSKGKIEVKDLKVRYAPESDLVLKGLTFTINPKEKIGIVGRTGSGKSTLALAFFRFMEPEEGYIVIDGIDISKVGIADLRSNLTIIPQDPVLFSGNLRSNLDLFGEFDDTTIYTALRRVELLPEDDDTSGLGNGPTYEELCSNIFADLETPVMEGGLNFSQGQRQLLCLARALLKKSQIVFMDEATSSVDFETDEAIQKAIAAEFSDCTIICIAHRLRTVIEYDKILVLDQGEIVEFDHPLALLNNPDSLFNQMCENTGEYESLVNLAKQKYQSKIRAK